MEHMFDTAELSIWKINFWWFYTHEDAIKCRNIIIKQSSDIEKLNKEIEELKKIVYWLSFVDKNITKSD